MKLRLRDVACATTRYDVLRRRCFSAQHATDRSAPGEPIVAHGFKRKRIERRVSVSKWARKHWLSCFTNVRTIIIIFGPTSTKPQAWKLNEAKLRWLQRRLIRKETAFPFEERWINVGRGMLFPWCPPWWRWCACQSFVSAEWPCRAMCQLSSSKWGSNT